MLPSRPGPSSTTSGAPVSMTFSPGLTPLVSSYTWMIVLSPWIWMTSPMSSSFPTKHTSYIRGRIPVAVTTGPATRSISPTLCVWISRETISTFDAAMLFTSFHQVHADGPLDLRPQVLLLELPDRDDHGPRDGLQAAAHPVGEPRQVVRVEDQDADVGVREDLGDPLLDLLRRHAVRLPDPGETKAEDERLPADDRDLHLRSPGAPGSPRS